MNQNKPIIIALVVVGVGILGLLAYQFGFKSTPAPEPELVAVPIPRQVTPPTRPDPEPEPVEVPVFIPEPVAVVQPEPAPEPVKPAFVLPVLERSDDLTRDAVSSLSAHQGLRTWLESNEIIRKFVAFVDNVAAGAIPRELAGALAPKTPFLANQVAERIYVLDIASYGRYDEVVDVLESIDAVRAAELYVLMRPLMQDAYKELGYGQRNFDKVLFQSIGQLLETPLLTQPIKLSRPVVMYEFADSRLEALSPAQKQLIRMGPDNTQRLQVKLGELARELRAILPEN